MDTYLFSDTGMRENDMKAVLRRMNRTFIDRLYRQNIEQSRRFNWLGITVTEAFTKITTFLEAL